MKGLFPSTGGLSLILSVLVFFFTKTTRTADDGLRMRPSFGIISKSLQVQ